jgi:predicted NBD/HSP70 family sugar kinase
LVLIGGGVVGAGEFLTGPIRAAVHERSMRASLQATRIDVAVLGKKSTVLGAVALALRQTYRSYVEVG